MNAKELYYDREDLMTPQEIEDFHHEPSTDEIPTFTLTLRQLILMGDSEFGVRPAPEAASRRRPPAATWRNSRLVGRAQDALCRTSSRSTALSL